jgi:hypothetical protein
MDLFIQDNFFNLPWQVAFVYDPKNEEEGVFTWQGGVASPARYLVRDDAAEFGGDLPPEAAREALAAKIERPVKNIEKRRDKVIDAAAGGDENGGDEIEGGEVESEGRPKDAAASAEAFAAAFPALTLDEFATRLLTLERRQRYSDAILGQRIEVMERRNRWLLVALAFTISFSVAWTLVIAPQVATMMLRPKAPTAAPAATTQPAQPTGAASALPGAPIQTLNESIQMTPPDHVSLALMPAMGL